MVLCTIIPYVQGAGMGTVWDKEKKRNGKNEVVQMEFSA